MWIVSDVNYRAASERLFILDYINVTYKIGVQYLMFINLRSISKV